MNQPEIVEAEIRQAEDEPALAIFSAPVPAGTPSLGLYGTADPIEVIGKATAIANALSDVIERQHLFAEIEGRKFVTVEGWTLLGSMLGVFPEIEWTRRIEDGWEARCVAKTLEGQVVGAAEALCSHAETQWSKREGKRVPRWKDEHSVRSMAQTRAVSKALGLPLRFIMVLAGYVGTPAEEMPAEGGAGRFPSFAPAPPSASSVRSGSATTPRAIVRNPVTIRRPPPGDTSKLEQKVEEAGVAEGAKAELRSHLIRQMIRLLRVSRRNEIADMTEDELWTKAADVCSQWCEMGFSHPMLEMNLGQLQAAKLRMDETVEKRGA